jgi:hypothetical protein
MMPKRDIAMQSVELPFLVELWSPNRQRVDRVLGGGVTVIIAEAAFRAAVEMYPARIILLRHGARVVQEHGRDARPSG